MTVKCFYILNIIERKKRVNPVLQWSGCLKCIFLRHGATCKNASEYFYTKKSTKKTCSSSFFVALEPLGHHESTYSPAGDCVGKARWSLAEFYYPQLPGNPIIATFAQHDRIHAIRGCAVREMGSNGSVAWNRRKSRPWQHSLHNPPNENKGKNLKFLRL